jgi:3-dehydroquinate synthase/shikimate kinase/3-dehydroquinate synthase
MNFLKTLPKRELICGYGEILKHALIANNKFFLSMFLKNNFKSKGNNYILLTLKRKK